MAVKYLEELSSGDAFQFDNTIYVLSSDFKKNGDRMSISIQSGQFRWLGPSTMVDNCELYLVDKDNNIIAIKPKDKEDVHIKT